MKVPDTTISDTGGKKRWGALAGRYVRAEIWRDLNEIDIAMSPGTWRKLLTQWKLNNTARNPVVHMNNVMSNLMFMDLADVRMQDLVEGIRAYAEGGEAFTEARDNGAFGADMLSQDIRDNTLKPILEEILREQRGGEPNSFLARAGALGRFADALGRKIVAADRKMIDLYRVEDEVFAWPPTPRRALAKRPWRRHRPRQF